MFLSANWDGYYDLETGILIYTWAVGRFHCDDVIHPHRDPHSHLYDESEWTHVATAYPVTLEGTVMQTEDAQFTISWKHPAKRLFLESKISNCCHVFKPAIHCIFHVVIFVCKMVTIT